MLRSIRLLLVVVPLFLVAGRARAYHLEDTLRGGTSGNPSGGSFGPDGWTVTGAGDRIWYALPRLTSGSIEFTLANVTLSNLTLADQEIFAMYEDGYGIGEPIRYSPEFRNNHYKMLVRIYGAPEGTRAGAMKMMWGLCPSGAPGYDTCGCGSFFQEPFADPGAWTGAPVRIRVEWGGGVARLLRDGAEVVRVDYASSGLSFGPSDLHMMLGSPRNDGGLSSMPIGAVFSDLVIDGTEGELATCPGAPDAGPPPDAGTCGADVATADAVAASWAPGVFADASDLNVEGDGASPTGIAYLRFPAIDAAIARATLRVHVSTVSSAGGGSGQVCRVEGGTWDEATLTWASRPTVSTACSGGARAVAADEEVSWDVTSIVATTGRVELAIVSTDGDGVHYLSRESGGCALGPRLEVELAPGVDGGAIDSGLDVDASASTADAARAADGGRRTTVEAGCGCRVGARSPAASALLAAGLALALVLARRRRRAISSRS